MTMGSRERLQRSTFATIPRDAIPNLRPIIDWRKKLQTNVVNLLRSSLILRRIGSRAEKEMSILSCQLVSELVGISCNRLTIAIVIASQW